MRCVARWHRRAQSLNSRAWLPSSQALRTKIDSPGNCWPVACQLSKMLFMKVAPHGSVELARSELFFLLLPNFFVAWILSDFRVAGRDV